MSSFPQYSLLLPLLSCDLFIFIVMILHSILNFLSKEKVSLAYNNCVDVNVLFVEDEKVFFYFVSFEWKIG
jgi:hypothetical protein